ncbi:threonine synthase [Methanohalobium evestigatum Z-7303]|uniref:Threonine synthase n=1 Tax=Methanohalobium evestigatum (strain ATCC BAA-1072 / DSM 3721 / NBRC 107634 / OCM 161 / Z-7303) TaxID=644295 RepID=D7EA91_METEZ|nr:threonine synthase [Methanohalobium evestigatum]ADI74762.1 threonine synthase [Methanohalobium evestigatum Z-7303]
MYHLECIECGKRYTESDVVYTCGECNGLLDVIYDYSTIELDMNKLKKQCPSVWKYREILPIDETQEPISIEEGGTPLYRCDRLADKIGIKGLYVKHEGLNPTGSFKDRGMTVGVSKAIELGMKTVACASTGNTSASLGIYGARAGIPAVVLLPEGKVALGKVAQALMHGAKVLSVRGNFDEALVLVRQLCDDEKFYLLNSVNPYRLEGQKTIGFEIIDQLGFNVPERVVLPVGNAGNITAIYKGFKEFMNIGITDKVPRMTGIQSEGAAPIVDAYRNGRDDITPEKNPDTIATAIRIGNPVNAKKALKAIYESNGMADTVTDDEIVQAQRDLAQLEGIGVEPASASSVAGLKKLVNDGIIGKDETVVCVTTGHLLKDPQEVVDVCPKPVVVDATMESIRNAVFSDK